MNALEEVVRRAVADLEELGRKLALVGGLAVSARTEPRFTRDADFAVAVDDDTDAEALAADLQGRGYRILAVVEQAARGRLSTLRLEPPMRTARGLVIDLLFASSGIEGDIAAAAEDIELFPGIVVPVARTGHLIALKVLARDDKSRPQDAVDLHALVAAASPQDRALAEAAVALIEERGFARGRDLGRLLQEALSLGSP